jgi:RNA polymerase sigma factor (sigma-70 family)
MESRNLREVRVVEERFNRLLTSPEYEKLRRRLISLFARRGCRLPEDLADETFARVMSKIPELAPVYEGDPVRFFYGVARNVYLEYRRRPITFPLPDNAELQSVPDETLRIEACHACLASCMHKLPAAERELVREYYLYEKRAGIDHRKEMAFRMGTTMNTLRLKAFRIRQGLHRCVATCLDNESGR